MKFQKLFIAAALLAFLPTLAHAQSTPPTVPISNCKELLLIGSTGNNLPYPLDGNYVLTQEIDCYNVTGFQPIGTTTAPFSGSLTGLYTNSNGQTVVNSIDNLSIQTTSDAAFFEALGGSSTTQFANIHDLAFSNLNVQGAGGTSTVAGLAVNTWGNTTVNNVTINGTIGTTSGNTVSIIAGAIGYVGGQGDKAATNDMIGHVTVNMQSQGDASNSISGFAYDNLGTIGQSSAHVSINTQNSAAGFVTANYGTVNNSYVTGTLIALGPDYGFAQSSNPSGTISNTPGTINDSYAAVKMITASPKSAGFLATGTATNSFWDSTLSGISTLNPGNGGSPETSTQMFQYSTFTSNGSNWDLNGTWSMYPNLRKPISLTVNVSGSGIVNISGLVNITSPLSNINCSSTCHTNLVPETVVVLLATPNSGNTFGSWSGVTCDEGNTHNTGTCSFRITGDTIVSASFTAVQQTNVLQTPTVTPATQTIVAGTTATFSGTIIGTIPQDQVPYAWQKNGVDIGGTPALGVCITTPCTVTYTTPKAQYPQDNGAVYTLVASNLVTTYPSNQVKMNVTPASTTPPTVSQLETEAVGYLNTYVGLELACDNTKTNIGNENQECSTIYPHGIGAEFVNSTDFMYGIYNPVYPTNSPTGSNASSSQWQITASILNATGTISANTISVTRNSVGLLTCNGTGEFAGFNCDSSFTPSGALLQLDVNGPQTGTGSITAVGSGTATSGTSLYCNLPLEIGCLSVFPLGSTITLTVTGGPVVSSWGSTLPSSCAGNSCSFTLTANNTAAIQVQAPTPPAPTPPAPTPPAPTPAPTAPTVSQLETEAIGYLKTYVGIEIACDNANPGSENQKCGTVYPTGIGGQFVSSADFNYGIFNPGLPTNSSSTSASQWQITATTINAAGTITKDTISVTRASSSLLSCTGTGIFSGYNCDSSFAPSGALLDLDVNSASGTPAGIMTISSPYASSSCQLPLTTGCFATFALNSVVTLTVSGGPVVSSWGSTLPSSCAGNSCSFTLTANNTAAIQVVPPVVTPPPIAPPVTTAVLTVAVNSTSMGTVTSSTNAMSGSTNCGSSQCQATFNQGTVTLKAVAKPGYAFNNWDGECFGSNPTCTFLLSTPVTVSAAFVAPPTITTAPTSQTAVVGSSVTFSASATGGAQIYTWMKQNPTTGTWAALPIAGTGSSYVISGLPTSTYTLPSVASADSGNYEVVVTNAAGSATSTMTLTVVTPSPVTTEPTKSISTGGGTAATLKNIIFRS